MEQKTKEFIKEAVIEEVIKDPSKAEAGEKSIEKFLKSKLFLRGIIGFGVFMVVAGGIYFYIINQRISIENSSIFAPKISLSSEHPGILEEIYVHPGQKIGANESIARISGEIIKSKTRGIIIDADPILGNYFNPGQTIVTMFNPDDLRVYGRVQEDKGLKDITVGDEAVFTADAFGSKIYQGEVTEIAEASRSQDVVFNISDKREEMEFVVKVKFDPDTYSELKPGMSARLWVYKK